MPHIITRRRPRSRYVDKFFNERKSMVILEPEISLICYVQRGRATQSYLMQFETLRSRRKRLTHNKCAHSKGSLLHCIYHGLYTWDFLHARTRSSCVDARAAWSFPYRRLTPITTQLCTHLLTCSVMRFDEYNFFLFKIFFFLYLHRLSHICLWPL